MCAPPPGVQILSISCSFWENLAKSYVGAPLGSWLPLLGEIVDPPLVSNLKMRISELRISKYEFWRLVVCAQGRYHLKHFKDSSPAFFSAWKFPQVLTYIFERFQNLVSTSSHVIVEGRLTFLTLQGDHGHERFPQRRAALAFRKSPNPCLSMSSLITYLQKNTSQRKYRTLATGENYFLLPLHYSCRLIER